MMISCFLQKLHSADASAIRVRAHSATTSKILVTCERESVEFLRVEQRLDRIFVDFARKLGFRVDVYEEVVLERERAAEEAQNNNIILNEAKH